MPARRTSSLAPRANPALLVVFASGLVLIITSVFYPLRSLGVFDAKRVLELGLFVALILFAVSWGPLRRATYTQLERVNGADTLALAAFFLIGFISAVRLVHPAYALLDVAMLLVMLLLIFITAASRNLSVEAFDRSGVVLLAVLGAAVFLQEFVGILAGWTGGYEFNYQLALIHFAHPRFFNHLQTWSIPVLAALPLLFPQQRGIKTLSSILLGLQWFLVMLTAARGTTVSLVTAMVFIAFWLPQQRRYWLKYQIAGLGVAIILYALVMGANTWLQPQSGSFYAYSAGRPMMNTSGRSFLWHLAVNNAFSHPVLGTGPAHYACDSKRQLPAHPHSFPLRILSEWGMLAFILLLILAGRLGIKFLKKIRHLHHTGQTDPPLRAMLATSLIAGVIHACVSGVMIMPASQMLMILIAGWMLDLNQHPQPHPEHPGSDLRVTVKGGLRGRQFLLVGTMMVACLQLLFMLSEIPRLHERTATAGTFGDAPGFWQNGKVCDYAYPRMKN